MAKKSKGGEGVGALKSWADLPEELLALIAERLHARLDFLRFCAVCSSWRSSARIVPRSFLIGVFRVPALVVSRDDQTIQKKFYTTEGFVCPYEFFHTNSIYLVQQKNESNPAESSSNKCWLGLFGGMHFAVPGKDKILGLGYRSKTIPKESNILHNLSMSELCNFYMHVGQLFTSRYLDHFNVQLEKIQRLALICSRSVVGEYAAVGLYDIHGKLAFLKSSKERIWTSVNNYEDGYTDVIDYNGRFYAVHCTGKLLRIDLSCQATEVASPIANQIDGDQKFLIESAGDLLLLDLTGFKVYKLNEEEGTQKLVEIGSLGDKMVFLTSKFYKFAVSAQHLPGCGPNCISFITPLDFAVTYHLDSRVSKLEGRTGKNENNVHFSIPPVA